MDNYLEYLWNMVFANSDPVGRWVNLVIFGLFLLAVADVISSLRALRLERAIIKRVREQFEGISGAPATDSDLLKRFNIPANSLLGRRVSRVMRLRQAGLGHREVLQQITAE